MLWQHVTFDTILCGISQIASTVYTINRVPTKVPGIVFQGKQNQTAFTARSHRLKLPGLVLKHGYGCC